MRRSRGSGRPSVVRPFLIAVLAVTILASVVVGLAALRLASPMRDLDRAVDLVDQASAALEDKDLKTAREKLDQAYAIVVAVNGSLYSAPEVNLAASIPFVEPNLEALRDGVALATRLVDGGRSVLRAAAALEGEDGQLELSLDDGTLPLDSVVATERALEAMAVDLPTSVPESDRFVVGKVEEASRRLHREAVRRRVQVDVLGRGISLLAELAGANGPRTYLVAVANTAEMRGTGGMILDYGVLHGEEGTIDLTHFGRIDELALPAPVAATGVPADYLARWEGFDPLQRWRNANVGVDFTIAAPVLERMFRRATASPVDGVIQIDPAGLAALLHGVGPVQVGELGQVTADNVQDLVLNTAYTKFPGIDERSDVLGDVAEAAFTRLVDGKVPSLRTLARSMAEAVDAHHVLVHSTAGASQAAVVAFGADGGLGDPTAVGPDVFALTAQNLSGNKLDYYLDTSLALQGERPEAAAGHLEASVVLTNTAPAGVSTPRYVFGPFPGGTVNLPAGVLRSLVTVYLPFGTSLAGATGDPTVEPATAGTEGGRAYATFTVDVAAGTSKTVVLSLDLAPRPPGPYSLVLMPSPRVRATQVSVDVDAGTAAAKGRVPLDREWLIVAGREPAPVPAPLYR